MASPVTPSEFQALIPGSTSSVCQAIKNTLIVLPAKLYAFFNWLLDSAGELTAEAQAFFAYASWAPGDIKASLSDSQPEGWLLCDGRQVNRTTYATLFVAIGGTFGSGDGLTTFNLPDFRGRTLIGSGQGTGLTARTIGQSGGAETHTLTESEMPSHDHVIPGAVNLSSGTTVTRIEMELSNTQPPESVNSNVAGGDGAHNNMQPYAVVHWFIKV